MLPTPKSIGFIPGQMMSSVSGKLNLRRYLESRTYADGGEGVTQDDILASFWFSQAADQDEAKAHSTATIND